MYQSFGTRLSPSEYNDESSGTDIETDYSKWKIQGCDWELNSRSSDLISGVWMFHRLQCLRF